MKRHPLDFPFKLRPREKESSNSALRSNERKLFVSPRSSATRLPRGFAQFGRDVAGRYCCEREQKSEASGIDCFVGWRGGSAQFGRSDSHGAGGGRAWRGDSGAARGGIDGHSGAGIGGSAGAFAGGEGDEPGARDGRVEGDGVLAGGT